MLKGKSAIVTGSTSGIGLGIAHVLASHGANIVINGFGDAAAIEAERTGIEKKHGVKCVYSSADMSKPEQIHAMVALCETSFGAADILVNNAGIQFTARTEAFPEEKWDAIISINLSSAFHAMKAILPGMQKRGFGRIINIASAHGLVGSPEKVAYVASKHGIVGMTKVVALENAAANITCNAVCPGWVLTPLVQKQIDDRAAKEGIAPDVAAKEMLSEKQPSLRFATPEQMGATVAFLCSDAGSSITGIALPVDGGWTAR
ncbi:MAG: 3-hydroxybutyrate dehydrogenase [Rickettsiales bacterium]|nr:3-hydroxybutyrate dehydrogenase [Rickettsiales bacterium]